MCFSTVCYGGLYVLTLRWVHRRPFKCSILYLFKTPPSCFKKNGTKFCIYSKRPPPTSKKAVPTTKEPIELLNSIFIQNAPSCYQKMSLLPEKSPQNDKFCIYSKRPPPTLYGAGGEGGGGGLMIRGLFQPLFGG